MLRDCKTLESISLDPHHRNIETLRALPNLQRISYEWDSAAGRPKHTAAEFWDAWDAQQAAKK